MEPTSLSQYTKDHFYTIIAIQAVFGLILGLIPLLLSFKRDRRNLGYMALGASLILSVISPILSLIGVIVFTVLIVRKPAAN